MRRIGKVFSVLGAWLAVAFGSTQAQALYLYYADDLEKKPGVIYVSKGFNTILQFYDRMDVYALSRQEIVQVQELSPSTLYFTTTNIQGMTGLTVLVGGRVLNFSIVVRPGDHNRTYRVEPSRLIYGTVSEPPREDLAERREREESGARTAPQTSQVTLVSASFSLATFDGKRAAITFSLRNLSNSEVYADVAKLSLTQEGRRLSFTVTRTPSRIRISPGETQTGTITVPTALSAPITLEWTLTSSKGEREAIRAIVPLNPSK